MQNNFYLVLGENQVFNKKWEVIFIKVYLKGEDLLNK